MAVQNRESMGKESEAALRKRLQALATAKNKAALEAVNEQAYQYRLSLDRVEDLSEDGPLTKGLAELFGQMQSSGWPLKPRLTIPTRTREALVQYLQLRKPIPYEAWRVVDGPDPARSDEENLEQSRFSYIAVTDDECAPRDRDIKDLLWMLGKLAHNAKSVFSSRIIRLLIDFEGINRWNWWVTAERASQLVNELAACWTLLMKEIQFLDPNEIEDLWPQRPAHHDDTPDAFMDTNEMDAESATEASRDRAWASYCRNLQDLTTPDEDENGEKLDHPMEILLQSIEELADEAKNGKASGDPVWRVFDYGRLERVLGVDTKFSYDAYEELNADDEESGESTCSELNEVRCSEQTRENEYKEKIVKHLARYLDAACTLARSKNSKSINDLGVCRSLLSQYNGDFFSPFDDEKLAAAKDLKQFMTCFKRARRNLWADCDNYTPPPPQNAIVVGFDKEGKRQAIQIFHTKPNERGYFSDKNLAALFHVKSENTIYNWRHGQGTPEGFQVALEKHNYEAMDKCAKKYTANRKLRKSDAMNTKRVVRNLSDEQQFREGAEMPDGNLD